LVHRVLRYYTPSCRPFPRKMLQDFFSNRTLKYEDMVSYDSSGRILFSKDTKATLNVSRFLQNFRNYQMERRYRCTDMWLVRYQGPLSESEMRRWEENIFQGLAHIAGY
jgi:hypothetical protein